MSNKLERLTECTYEIRPDNTDQAKAGEWAVYAVGGNEHARRIAYTTDKREADAILVGLLSMHEKAITRELTK